MPSAKKFKAIDIVGSSTWNNLTDQQKIKLEVLANKGKNAGVIKSNARNFINANVAKYAGTIKRGIEGKLEQPKKKQYTSYNTTRFTTTQPNNLDMALPAKQGGTLPEVTVVGRNKKQRVTNTTIQPKNTNSVNSRERNQASNTSKISNKVGSTPARSNKPATHTISQGETLSGIAKRYGVDWRQLAKDNGIEDPNMIVAGRKLNINGSTKNPKRNKPRRSIRTTPSARELEANRPGITREQAIIAPIQGPSDTYPTDSRIDYANMLGF